jgi:hypothetical protein
MPSPVAGYSLWLKADAGVLDASNNPCTDGVAVATWQDQSGNGYDVTQATSGNRPVLKSSGINGLPSIRSTSSGSGTIGQYLTNPINFASPCTIFIVARLWSLADNAGRIFSGLNNNWLLGWWNAKQDVMYAVGTVNLTGVSVTTNSILYSAVVGSSAATFWNDGTQVTSQSGTFPGPNRLQIGGGAGGAGPDEYSSADVGEILIYPSALSTGDRQSVESYLTAKWFGGSSGILVPNMMFAT